MQKIILNSCYGGYSWSEEAIREIVKLKQRNGTHNHLYDEYGFDIDRKDPEAIVILSVYGSDFCSGSHARLVIEEYDNTLFEPRIERYDGVETLHLYPHITEDRIRSCKTMDEICDLLREVGVLYAS